MADEDDSSVSDEKGHSGPLRVAAEAGARLSAPVKAPISRERKVQKKRCPRHIADPYVKAWDRLIQFKGEHLTVVSGNSGCDAWKKTMFK